MQFFRCTRCLYPNTKPDIWFDASGLCSACQAFDRRAAVDWAAKQREFMELVNANRGKTHDVVVACSGGKDSTWQIIRVKELGFRPLAVTASTDHLSDVGRRNLENISRLCDHVTVTPNRDIRRRISKFALMEVGDISWAEHHLIWSVPAREAAARDIPLVLYGECPQNEYGAGPIDSERTERLTEGWVHEFGGLLGLRLDDLSEILGIGARELDVYRRPAEVSGVFMGAYFPWDGLTNCLVAEQHGFTRYHQMVEGSLCDYENLDNNQTGPHDLLRFFKFGYSRACDIACNHIRRGRMTREHAASAVMAVESQPWDTYLGVPLRDILAHIDVSLAEWRGAVDRFANHEVVQWGLSPASYQSFYGGQTGASKADSGTRAAVSVQWPTESGSLNAAI
jgi:N-acetyl sugar amidotransferase